MLIPFFTNVHTRTTISWVYLFMILFGITCTMVANRAESMIAFQRAYEVKFPVRSCPVQHTWPLSALTLCTYTALTLRMQPAMFLDVMYKLCTSSILGGASVINHLERRYRSLPRALEQLNELIC